MPANRFALTRRHALTAAAGALMALSITAPALFSPTNRWPSLPPMAFAAVRPMMSVGPPGGKGTISRPGRVG